jgi:hypothetical protein
MKDDPEANRHRIDSKIIGIRMVLSIRDKDDELSG